MKWLFLSSLIFGMQVTHATSAACVTRLFPSSQLLNVSASGWASKEEPLVACSIVNPMNAPVDVSFFHIARGQADHQLPPYWAKRFGTAPFLPMSRAEMEQLGWDSCDVVLVTGDAYVDHPSFGMAVIGRVLEAQGFRVGIIAQPDWHSAEPFKALGKPNLFWGVTAGNMDSMINRYTADRKIRSDDAYTPGDVGGKRPGPRGHCLQPALPRGLQGRAHRAGRHRGQPCAASRTTTTGATRCAAPSWWTPSATCCCTATPSARSSRLPTAWRAASRWSASPMCAARPSSAARATPAPRAGSSWIRPRWTSPAGGGAHQPLPDHQRAGRQPGRHCGAQRILLFR
jgi:hypothetical protein